MKNKIFIIISIITLISCEPHVKVDAPGLREAVENRKIKQIHEPDIQKRALLLSKNLTKKVDSTINAYYPSLDSIECKTIATINLSKIKGNAEINILCNLNEGDSMEKQLFDALKYNFENNIEYTSTVQKFEEKYYVIHPISSDKILKGAISVILPKKDIVLSLSDDTWKYKYENKRKNSLILILVLLSSTAFSQVSRTIDSLMTIPLIQGTYAFDIPGGDLADRFGFNNEVGIGFMVKNKKGWLYGVEGNFVFGNQVKGDTINIENLRDNQGRILGSNTDGAYFTDYNLFQRGAKLPLFKFGKVFHKSWFKASANSGPFITAGIGYWQYKLKVHDIDRSIDALKDEYVKGYDHLTGGLMTSQSVGYLLFDKNKLINISLSFEFSQGYTKNLRSWNMSSQGPINDKRLDLNYGFKLSWYFPIYPKIATGYYYY